MESYCRICGILLENTPPEIRCCKSSICEELFQSRLLGDEGRKKKKKTARMRSLEVQFRPWSSGCIDNLYKNMLLEWPAEKTAKETNRAIDEVQKMMERIRREGYEKIYYELLEFEKELKKRNRKVLEKGDEFGGIELPDVEDDDDLL
ncbi:MAG: hypothetical protein PHQ23_01645 [Candidatus Wallbacteria bacterium]|nr:hypothetical protein [Candidatus Wallbacteria bacterium]